MPITESDRARKRRILEALARHSLAQAVADPILRSDLEAEADSADPRDPSDPQKLVTRDLLQIADARRRTAAGAAPFFSSADVIIVPAFLGSELADEAPGGRGLIWIDPKLP